MITVIDYGGGNTGSLINALRKIGVSADLSSDAKDLLLSERIFLPGVGSFDDVMGSLRDRKLIEPIRQAIVNGIPFLGICVGYQALFSGSDEGKLPGLGILSGRSIRFSTPKKIPQIGWNQISDLKGPLFKDITKDSFFYFVHSYYPTFDETQIDIASSITEYGDRFVSSIWKQNVFGTQFHPEKSGKDGLKLLKNFMEV